MVGTRPSKGQREEIVGQKLRSIRQRRGLSLDTISEELIIPVQYLASLEEGDLTIFSAEVYARGVYMKYATYLGVETHHLDQVFLQALCRARELVPLRLPVPRAWLTRVMTGRWLLMVVLGMLTVSVGTYIAWQIQSFLRLPHLALQEPARAVVNSQDLIVRGQVEAEAIVTVNGQAALVEQDGRFSMSVSLHPGINVLQVEAKNAAGRSRIIEKDLLLPRR